MLAIVQREQAKNSHSNQKLTSSEDSFSEDESSFVFFATFPLVAFLATSGSFKDKTLKVLERRYTKYKTEAHSNKNPQNSYII